MNHLPETLDELSARVNALERRVCTLEQGAAAPALTESPTLTRAAVISPAPEVSPGEQISSAFAMAQ